MSLERALSVLGLQSEELTRLAVASLLGIASGADMAGGCEAHMWWWVLHDC